jgi:hypothetical protein
MSSKQCFVCLFEKPTDEFYPHSKMKDGRLNKCKECTKAAVIANRNAKIEYYRAFDRIRSNLPHRVNARAAYRMTDEYRISHAISVKNWGVANAIRKKAATAVSNALRDGRLDRQPCFVCGNEAQAHHPDYSAPLAVSWLCSTHHAQTHKEHRERMRTAETV